MCTVFISAYIHCRSYYGIVFLCRFNFKGGLFHMRVLIKLVPFWIYNTFNDWHNELTISVNYFTHCFALIGTLICNIQLDPQCLFKSSTVQYTK